VNPEFLELDDVLDIHARQMDRFGGAAGIRDLALLESALAQPAATFDGAFTTISLTWPPPTYSTL
jgi:death-on-curing protein